MLQLARADQGLELLEQRPAVGFRVHLNGLWQLLLKPLDHLESGIVTHARGSEKQAHEPPIASLQWSLHAHSIADGRGMT